MEPYFFQLESLLSFRIFGVYMIGFIERKWATNQEGHSRHRHIFKDALRMLSYLTNACHTLVYALT